jgi:hypothetical protein
MQVPFLAPYLILIVVTRSALLRLRLVSLYRTFIPMALALALHSFATVWPRCRSLPFSMILSPFCFYVESL